MDFFEGRIERKYQRQLRALDRRIRREEEGRGENKYFRTLWMEKQSLMFVLLFMGVAIGIIYAIYSFKFTGGDCPPCSFVKRLISCAFWGAVIGLVSALVCHSIGYINDDIEWRGQGNLMPLISAVVIYGLVGIVLGFVGACLLEGSAGSVNATLSRVASRMLILGILGAIFGFFRGLYLWGMENAKDRLEKK